MNAEEIIKKFPKTLLNWYSFKRGESVLFISGGFAELGVLLEVFAEKNMQVLVKAEDEIETLQDTFDYIVLAGVIEKSKNVDKLLRQIKGLLKLQGKLFLLADNRLAIRYFCGDKDRFTKRVIDGLDNYCKVDEKLMKKIDGRAYSKAELSSMLGKAGLKNFKFYSVMPSLERPHMLIADNYKPNELLDSRIFPYYYSPKTIFIEEENLYEALLENDMFHQMANGFLIECTINAPLSCIDEVTVQEDRAQSQAMATILRQGKYVIKKALYKEGQIKIEQLKENTDYLKKHRVPMVEADINDDSFVMPYVDGVIATKYFRDLLKLDKGDFFKELSRFRDILEHSSEAVSYDKVDWSRFDPDWKKRKQDDPNLDKWKNLAFGSREDKKQIGTILKRGYIDLVSLNCMRHNNEFCFFDQEFYIENYPVNAIFIRTIDMIYNNCCEIERLYPRDELLREFNLYEHRNVWRRMSEMFLMNLRNEIELASYHRVTRRDWSNLNVNRHRMNYSQDEYDKLFNNIFKNVENKKIYLFGSGMYAKDFIKRFSDCCEIVGILDNNDEMWGKKLSGIKIYNPMQLKEEEMPYKVFICIKYYQEVLLQLQFMGVEAISVYEPRLDYERPLKNSVCVKSEIPKKYHIGYVAGVFDLFHVGHLNLLRRAKEQCDYLIVGVVSDEQVVKEKKTTPYITFGDRLEIVQACRYVDEAVALPIEASDTEDSYRKYHFDVQFSGSDYANDPVWLAKKTFLRENGSDLIFFPYTESVSSTKVKGMIKKV